MAAKTMKVKIKKDCDLGSKGDSVDVRLRNVAIFIDRGWIETPKGDYPAKRPTGLHTRAEKVKIREARKNKPFAPAPDAGK